MHGRFSAATAIDLAHMLEPYRPGWIEEPCPPEDVPSLIKVAEHVNLPVATGEARAVNQLCLNQPGCAVVAQPARDRTRADGDPGILKEGQ